MHVGPTSHCEDLAFTVREARGPERFEQSTDMILVVFSRDCYCCIVGSRAREWAGKQSGQEKAPVTIQARYVPSSPFTCAWKYSSCHAQCPA